MIQRKDGTESCKSLESRYRKDTDIERTCLGRWIWCGKILVGIAYSHKGTICEQNCVTCNIKDAGLVLIFGGRAG